MALDVTVSIELTKPIGSIGTWFPLLYVVDSEATSDAYNEVTTLAEVVNAGYSASSDVYQDAALIFMQNNAPAKIAILKQSAFSSTTIKEYLRYDWRQFVLVGTHSNISTIATYFETLKDRMLFFTVKTKAALGTVSGSTVTKTYSGERTFAVFYNILKEPLNVNSNPINAAAAIVGATAGLEAGSFTYKNMIIKGLEAVDITPTDLSDVHALGGVTILEKAGDIVTSEGKTASSEYADVVDSKDYIIKKISYNTQKVFNNNDKVPYTNAGIGMLEAATLEALVDGYNNGMIATNDDGTPDYSVSFALRSETSETDRSNRSYPYGRFSFGLAGAVHNATIKGTISV